MIRIDTGFLFINPRHEYFKDFVFKSANYEVFNDALFELVKHEIIIRIHSGSYWMVLK